jgi:hypothetical protein
MLANSRPQIAPLESSSAVRPATADAPADRPPGPAVEHEAERRARRDQAGEELDPDPRELVRLGLGRGGRDGRHSSAPTTNRSS